MGNILFGKELCTYINHWAYLGIERNLPNQLQQQIRIKLSGMNNRTVHCVHICRFVEHCTTTCAAIFVVHVYVSTVSMIPNVRRVSNWGYDYYRVCPEIIAQSQGAQNSYRPEKWTKT